MTQLVQVFVILTLFLAVLPRRYDGLHVLRSGLVDNLVAVVPLVGEQPFRSKAFNQVTSLLTIMDGTLSDRDSDRHTIRIHGQMYLGAYPLLCVPYPDSHPLPLPREDEP